MTTTYKITITKTETTERKKLWAPLKTKTPTSFRETQYGGREPVYTEEYHEPASVTETDRTVEDIYEQVVENLDLVKVINAINQQEHHENQEN